MDHSSADNEHLPVGQEGSGRPAARRYGFGALRPPAWAAAWRERPPAALLPVFPVLSRPGDGHEAEADRMAAGARGRGAGLPAAERDGPRPGEKGAESGEGRPLDPGTRAFMERRLGHDFSGVRVYDGPPAAEAARAVGALAFTSGQRIVFDAGQYAPETDAGRGLLAHELAHVVQQRTGAAPRGVLQRQARPGATPANPWSSSPTGLTALPPNLTLTQADFERLAAQQNPEIQRWLDRHAGTVRTLSMPDLIRTIRSQVPAAARRDDGTIAAVIGNWLDAHGIVLPAVSALPGFGPSIPPAPPPPENPLVATVQQALTTVEHGLPIIGTTAGRTRISVSGALSGLRLRLSAPGATTEVTASWGGTLGFEHTHGDFHFSGSISSERWELGFSYSVDSPIPDLNQLGRVFSEGEAAVRNIVRQAGTFGNLSDIPRIAEAIHPSVQPVSDAVDAVQGIAGAGELRPGRVAVGVSASGAVGTPGAGGPVPPPATEVSVTVTIRF